MLGREAVLDAHHRHPRLLGELHEQQVLAVGRADRPAAAVDVQVRAARALRLDEPERDRPAAARDLDRARLFREDERREDAASLAARAARLLGRQRVHGRQLRERRGEQLVEGPRLCEYVVVGHGHRGVCFGRVPGGTTSIDCPRSTRPPLGCAGGGRYRSMCAPPIAPPVSRA